MTEAVVERAKAIIKEGESRNITLRLLGALAFRLRNPSAQKWASQRPISDLDFFGRSRHREAVEELMNGLGLVPRTTFNMLHGNSRLIFYDKEINVLIDVFFDRFKMCHTFDFRDRLELDKVTLPLADLLMTKLQIVQLNEKDARDLLFVLNDHGLGPDDNNHDLINIDYISRICSQDWGIYRTFTVNLNKVKKLFEDGFAKKEDYPNVASNLAEICSAIESREKSVGWKLRAQVGERKRWYELPDETGPASSS